MLLCASPFFPLTDLGVTWSGVLSSAIWGRVSTRYVVFTPSLGGARPSFDAGTRGARRQGK